MSIGGKANSNRCVLRCFLKVATEMAEWTDSGRLVQRSRAQERKAPAPVLTPGTNTLIPFLISVNGMGAMMRQAWSEDKQAVFHEWFVNQQTDLEQYSKFYW